MMVTGEVPFAKTSPLDCWMKKVKNDFPAPRKLNPRLSERVDWAIRRAMSAEPRDRPATCREFVEDLTGQTARRGGTGSGSVHDSTPAAAPVPPQADLWYLVYRGATGEPLTVKGTTDSIRQNVKAGNLGDPSGVLVCRTKTGQFVPLRNVAEFRDLVIAPSAGRVKGPAVKPTVADPARPAIKDTQPANRSVPPYVAHDPASDVPTDPHPVSALSTPSDDEAPWDQPAARRATGPRDERAPVWLPWVLIGVAVAAAAAGAFILARS
jgi:hypothetical protein